MLQIYFCLFFFRKSFKLFHALPGLCLSVKAQKWVEAQVNAGTNYESLKVAKCLVG